MITRREMYGHFSCRHRGPVGPAFVDLFEALGFEAWHSWTFSWPGRGRAAPGLHRVCKFQAEPIRNMMHKGMTELTGAGDWAEAWRLLSSQAMW